MIKANFQFIDSNINYISINGHANSDVYGKDLVCAAVSGIVGGALNALDLNFNNNLNIEILENKINIKVLNFKDKELQAMLLMLKIQLDSIAVQYPNNIIIKEVI